MNQPHSSSDHPVGYTITEQATAYLNKLAGQDANDSTATKFQTAVELFTTSYDAPNQKDARTIAAWLSAPTTTDPTVAQVARWSAAMCTPGRDHITAAIIEADNARVLLTRLRWLSRRAVGRGQNNLLGALALAEFTIGSDVTQAIAALDTGGAASVLGEITNRSIMAGIAPSAVQACLHDAVNDTRERGTLR